MTVISKNKVMEAITHCEIALGNEILHDTVIVGEKIEILKKG